MAVPAGFASNAAAKNYALTAADIKAGLHLNTRITPCRCSILKRNRFFFCGRGNDTRNAP